MGELTPGDQAQRAFLIEAFAAGPLQGNGAAVVKLTQAARSEWMQALAGSLQQSETAFLWRNPAGQWCLRWFTPTCEVPLCGHATLASTLALQRWGQLRAGEELVLASRSGAFKFPSTPRPRERRHWFSPVSPSWQRPARAIWLGCSMASPRATGRRRWAIGWFSLTRIKS